ncbi:MAG: carboxypeptidase M32, partial [Aureliella sp.]
FIGRSQPFWLWAFPHIARMSDCWQGLDAQSLYRDANRVEPSLVRVEADEVTYNLHILIRFEIEQALLSGELPVDDAPQAWNERYEHYLGIKPPNHSDGILQDVHWSAGLVGYFPTYTLGNLYAAQLMEAMQRELGELDPLIAMGQFQPVLSWLRATIHEHGACYHPVKLIENACSQPLDARPLVNYLRGKLTPIYEL